MGPVRTIENTIEYPNIRRGISPPIVGGVTVRVSKKKKGQR
jgi:hypothetical protein